MTCDLTIWTKAAVVGGCNLIGVFVVKLIEERKQKDKLWKIEVTIPTIGANNLEYNLQNISHSRFVIDSSHTVFSFYCKTKAESKYVYEIIRAIPGAKWFTAENKNLY